MTDRHTMGWKTVAVVVKNRVPTRAGSMSPGFHVCLQTGPVLGAYIPVVFLLAEKCRVAQLLEEQRGWSGPPSSADSGPGTAADFYDSTWKCSWLRGDLAERRRKKKMEGGMKKTG